MLRFRALAALALFCAPLVQLLAQAPGTGLYTLGSFDSRGLDSINIGNLNIHFEIPIVNKPGRGLPFQYNLVYDGLIWSASGASGAQYWTPDPNWGFHGQVNGQINDGLTGHVTYNSTVQVFPARWKWNSVVLDNSN